MFVIRRVVVQSKRAKCIMSVGGGGRGGAVYNIQISVLRLRMAFRSRNMYEFSIGHELCVTIYMSVDVINL